ncbi:MAG: hypothetical protein AABY03_00450 [Nanoarchaeota archaeon]
MARKKEKSRIRIYFAHPKGTDDEEGLIIKDEQTFSHNGREGVYYLIQTCNGNGRVRVKVPGYIMDGPEEDKGVKGYAVERIVTKEEQKNIRGAVQRREGIGILVDFW